MSFKRTIIFIFQSVLLGLVAALIVILIRPDLLNGDHNRGSFAMGLLPDIELRDLKRQPASYSRAVERTSPAVVNIYAQRITVQAVHPLFQDPIIQRFFGKAPERTQQDSQLGSGVIISQQGYILTNNHIVANANQIQVTLLDGRQLSGQLVGNDPDTDLAVIKIEADDLPTIRVGNSRQLKVGDVVLAIGNPYNLGQTVTQGIVSATGRKRLGITQFEDFIQTDADINPGNSGGALITANGQLVGINTMIYTRSGGSQGIGFATPTHIALDVMQQLINHGQVIRGWLGIEAQNVTPDLARTLELQEGGIVIAGIYQNGPADAAGLKPGDIIVSVNDHLVMDASDAINRIARVPPGKNVSLNVIRGWEEMTFSAEVIQRPRFDSPVR